MTSAIASLSYGQTMAQVQTAVARKMLDSERQQGAAAIQLLQSATQTQVKAGDSLVAAAVGLGGQVDVYA
ncbi:MAG: hypothetical protein ACFCVE_15885 [Phycisphaerae bacterium]